LEQAQHLKIFSSRALDRQIKDSIVPAGLDLFVSILPAVETAGYFRSPLCGWK
jgi:hypothetical protein